MKTGVSPALVAHFASGAHSLAIALKVTRKDGAVYGFTSADIDLVDVAITYLSAPGMDVSSFVTSAGLSVDNAEITILTDDAIITKLDVLAGKWNGAQFSLFRYNWASPSDGQEPIARGTLGDLQPKGTAYVAELRGLKQYLQQPIGSISTKTCRARLGDAMCKVALAPFTFSGTVTAVTNRQTFVDAANGQVDGYFAEGLLTWTSGANVGLSQKVKTFEATQFTLSLPMISQVVIGDAYVATAGCHKRLEDCIGKFSNVLNFQGEPHRPTTDALVSAPDPSGT